MAETTKSIGDARDAEIAALKAQLAAMQASQASRLTAKVVLDTVTGKPKSGALSLYGLGRFPVTLYAEQWQRLEAWIKAGHLQTALDVNKALLATKANPNGFRA